MANAEISNHAAPGIGTADTVAHLVELGVYVRTHMKKRLAGPPLTSRNLGWHTGLEPATPRSTIWCSNHLS